MKVKFVPQNVEFEIRPGQSVLELAQEKGVHIRTSCNGLPSCAECRIRVTEGDYNVSPPTTKELNLIGTGYFLDQRRLSCQLTCFGDVTIDTSEHVGKEGEGAVTKQFLQRVHKASAEETHSVNGVLIEQDADLLNSTEARETEEPVAGKSRQQQQNQQQGPGQGGKKHHSHQKRQQHNNKNKNNNQQQNQNRGPNPHQGKGNRPGNSPRPMHTTGRSGGGKPT